MSKEYLWRDYILTKKQLKKILSKEEYDNFFNMKKNIEELDKYISNNIQGVFSPTDMQVMKEEAEKLKPGDVYVEVGVDEGRSARVLHEYAHPDVYKLYIDINNVDPHKVSIGRGKWMQQEGMVGIGKKGFFIHGDADIFQGWFPSVLKFVNLIFLDPHHDYESIKSATLAWEPFMKRDSTMLFHDTDHPETYKFLDDHFGKGNWENHHGKVGIVRK